MCGAEGGDPWEPPGNIDSPCPAKGLNIRTWWNSKGGTAASSHQGSLQGPLCWSMLRGLKSVTWQLLPQHAPSFEGKSSKLTHTLGFDFLFFLKWINWIKQTSCSEEMGWFGSTALLSATSTVAGRRDGCCTQAPRSRGEWLTPCHWLPVTIWWWAKRRPCWESWTAPWPGRQCTQLPLTAPIPSEPLGRGLCNHRELWRKLTAWTLMNLLCHSDSHSLKTEGSLICGSIL